jgi:hypothetical protein
MGSNPVAPTLLPALVYPTQGRFISPSMPPTNGLEIRIQNALQTRVLALKCKERQKPSLNKNLINRQEQAILHF